LPALFKLAKQAHLKKIFDQKTKNKKQAHLKKIFDQKTKKKHSSQSSKPIL
jgi:hypothetical protein